MGVYTKDGTRRTKTSVATAAVSAADTPKVINEDLYRTRKYGQQDPKPEGSIKELLVKAGTVMKQSDIDLLFPLATVTGISPASGAAAGGTVVTITGTDLDGTTSVTFGGTAGTALQVVDDKTIKVTTPAKAAGAVAVAVVDDGGTVTKSSFYTFV